MLTDVGDRDKIWSYLQSIDIISVTKEKPDDGRLSAKALSGTLSGLFVLMVDAEMENLSLTLLHEGTSGDKKARLARLRQSIATLLSDIAKVRILTLSVTDINTQKVDRLEAGLPVKGQFDFTTHFNCIPSNLSGTSASKWEHPRSYLFNTGFVSDLNNDSTTEVNPAFNYQYNINNTIGQFEDWEASLALELLPNSATDGPAFYTTEAAKLDALLPTEKGLSIEAWIKPAASLNSPGTIVSYANKDQDRFYSLEIIRDSSKYRCAAVLGNAKYISKNTFTFKDSFGKEQSRHIAFTHRKYWGYRLGTNEMINCGNDNSLQLDGEFALEVLVKITKPGKLVEKVGEYILSIEDKKIVFSYAGQLVELKDAIEKNETFYKITFIRSRNKLQSEFAKEDYPITGAQSASSDSKSKWYEGKDNNELMRGMAEKQDQIEKSMSFAKLPVADLSSVQSDFKVGFHHSIIVSDGNGSAKEWTNENPVNWQMEKAYNNFFLGGGNFEGVFTSVRVWSRALSKQEAMVLSVAENKAGLVSHWRFSEGRGSHLYDNVRENHGILIEHNDILIGNHWTDSPQTNRIGQFQFYVDGTPEMHDTSTENLSPENHFSLGAIKQPSDFANHFNGSIEEIRIWNTPRSEEQITDNAFGRLKGEWEQLLANYTFDNPINSTENIIQDNSLNNVSLIIHNRDKFREVLSTAPIATEIPQVRSALTGVITEYNDTISCSPAVVEYGDIQKNEDGTIDGILKRCYSFIDENGKWNRMTGYKVGNLVSEWFGQAQFAPQVVGFIEGPPPVPAENFPVIKEGDVDMYASFLNNSLKFRQAEEVSYNFSTSKESGWRVGVEAEGFAGVAIDTIIAPFGIGLSVKGKIGAAVASNWETTGKRSESYERGTSSNTEYAFSASLAGYDNRLQESERYYMLGNTGFALVKSKTADVYLLRLAHNNAFVSINWQPNPDIPEDVNIISFPINPLYVKQGCLDGKFGGKADIHYSQAQSNYGEYSYFKPREAYRLKKLIEREKLELKAYFEDGFDIKKTNSHFQVASSATGIAQLTAFFPAYGPIISSIFNQTMGQIATQIGYDNTSLKEDFSEFSSQRNLVNTYVWSIEGGFYAESTSVAETQQEVFANETSLSLGGGAGLQMELEAPGALEQKTLFNSGSSFTLTKTKTKNSSTSFGLDVNVTLPTSPIYKFSGVDGRSLAKGLISPGIVDAYRFMSFYLEPKGSNFADLFTEVIDPIWLEESPDPYAQALRQARGDDSKS